jgi:hypothetical protein
MAKLFTRSRKVVSPPDQGGNTVQHWGHLSIQQQGETTQVLKR